MAKSSNPADSHRKAMKAKEIKKNKEARKGAREVAIVKTDTRSLENDIKLLNSKAQRAPLSNSDKLELESAKIELAKIIKAKQDYVEAHPESRKVVFPERVPEVTGGSGSSSSNGSNQQQFDNGHSLYLKDGKLRNPELSYYYDSIFNPFGAPPPGMPYRRRDPTEEEKATMIQAQMVRTASLLPPPPPLNVVVEEDEESDDDDDDEDDDDEDEIALPEGPKPDQKGLDSSSNDSDDDDDDDDIAMPAGPPPPKPGTINLPTTSNNSRITIARPSSLPFNPNFNSYHHYQQSQYQQQQQQQQQQRTFHPQPFHPDPHMRYGPRQPPPPPPPPGMGPRNLNNNNNSLPPRPMNTQPQSQTLDPLNLGGLGAGGGSGEGKNVTYQSFMANRHQQQQNPSSSSGGPSSGPSSISGLPRVLPTAITSATISAAPQLRDLKKEATAFLPSHMRRKKQKLSTTTTHNVESVAKLGTIDAARGEVGTGGGERASLMGALRGVGIGPVLPSVKSNSGAVASGKEDYERFKREMEDFL